VGAGCPAVTLLEAVYDAERREFTPSKILGAFRRCGLWPFSPKRALAQVADALGLGHTDDSVRGLASAAASDVIQKASIRAKAAKKRTSTGSAVVERAVLHAPNALLERSRKIEADNSSGDAVKAPRAVIHAHKREKETQDEFSAAAAGVDNLCKVCAGRSYRGGKGWSGCNCGRFRVCPGCTNTPAAAAEAVEGHQEECRGEVLNGSSGEESGESDEEKGRHARLSNHEMRLSFKTAIL